MTRRRPKKTTLTYNGEVIGTLSELVTIRQLGPKSKIVKSFKIPIKVTYINKPLMEKVLNDLGWKGAKVKKRKKP